jgi:hypothetical protein
MENTVSVPWTLTLNNSTVSFNTAGDAGGGVETDGSGKVFINASSIVSNTTVNQGAGIWLDAVQDGTVFQSAILTVNQSVISNNTALAGPGGGIGDAGNDTFLDALGNVTRGQTTISNSTLANNFAGLTGGGFGDENGQDSLEVLNSTFDHNSAFGKGGGGIEFAGLLTKINASTITSNITQGQGGGVALTGTQAILDNTIIAQNFSDSTGAMNFLGTAPDILAAIIAGSGNFIGIGDANLTGLTDGTNGNHVGTVANPLDPLLGPLQNNGGATPTRAPLAGSPVIDAGINGVLPANTLTDQRGFLRIVNNTVDIGAVEFQPPATTTLLTASSLTTTLGQPVTFTATVMAQTPMSNMPTGSVTFTIDGVPQAPVTLNNGVASLTLLSLPAGPHMVTATYSGDVNFTTSSASVTETVQGLRDVTGLIKVTLVKRHKGHNNTLMETLMLTNMSGAPITGPVYVVLDGLMGAMLKNATGHSQTHVTPGDPFVLVSMGDLGAGQSQMVNLLFAAGKKGQVNFNTFVLAGPGVV